MLWLPTSIIVAGHPPVIEAEGEREGWMEGDRGALPPQNMNKKFLDMSEMWRDRERETWSLQRESLGEV